MEKRQAAYNEQVEKYISVSNKDSGYDREISEDASLYIDNENKAFKFNGNNYIEIFNENGFDFSKGLTFEFYGKISKDFTYAIQKTSQHSFLAMWDGNHSNFALTRFSATSITDSGPKEFFHCLLGNCDNNIAGGAFTYLDSLRRNQSIPFKENSVTYGNDVYLSFSVTPEGEDGNFVQSLYVNAELENSGWLSKSYYDYFVNNVKNLNYIELGRCTFESAGNWVYLTGFCYSLRIYNRALNTEELEKNYNTSKVYHNTLLGDNN